MSFDEVVFVLSRTFWDQCRRECCRLKRIKAKNIGRCSRLDGERLVTSRT